MAHTRPAPWAGRTWAGRAIGNPPGTQEPGSFGRAGALEAALRGCLGLPPVS